MADARTPLSRHQVLFGKAVTRSARLALKASVAIGSLSTGLARPPLVFAGGVDRLANHAIAGAPDMRWVRVNADATVAPAGGDRSHPRSPADHHPVSQDCAAKRDTSGYDVVLLMGQSNMSGYGAGYDAAIDGVQDARILQWSRAGAPVAASEPLQHADWRPGSMRVGLGTAFARSYLATLPGKRGVLLVPTASGGTALYYGPWSPGGKLYEDAVQRLKRALAHNPGNCVAAVLWHQGEADAAGNTSAANYEAALRRMVADLRSRVPRSARAPFIAGEMTPVWQANPGMPVRQVKAIVSALNQVTSTTAYAAFAPANGIQSVNPGDPIHFDAPAMRAYGRRYFESLKLALERR